MLAENFGELEIVFFYIVHQAHSQPALLKLAIICSFPQFLFLIFH